MSGCHHNISARAPKLALSILVTLEPSGAVHASLITCQMGSERPWTGETACREAGPFDSVLELPAWLEDQVVRWLGRHYARL